MSKQSKKSNKLLQKRRLRQQLKREYENKQYHKEMQQQKNV